MNCAKKKKKESGAWCEMIMNQKHRRTRFIAFTVVVFVTGCCCSLTFKCTNLSRYKCVSSKNVSSSIEGGDHFTAVNVQTFYICHFCSFLVVFGLVRHSPSAVMHYLLMRLKLSQICSVYFSFFFFLLTDTNCYVRPTGWFLNRWSNVLAADWNKSILN